MAERLVHMFGVPAWRHFKKIGGLNLLIELMAPLNT